MVDDGSPASKTLDGKCGSCLEVANVPPTIDASAPRKTEVVRSREISAGRRFRTTFSPSTQRSRVLLAVFGH